ncbi:hypothetical protein JOQ06_015020 [Pogonophryne albipinna]|uniref:Uncharacterized protein n=1 Tax=Pogonophryne albipinna TaxID=1090488 RepID=A0AAD6AM05_9TELE|nr:hypothetical protein JOQ06_015020 [Pogonophryne albipinna]
MDPSHCSSLQHIVSRSMFVYKEDLTSCSLHIAELKLDMLENGCNTYNKVTEVFPNKPYSRCQSHIL